MNNISKKRKSQSLKRPIIKNELQIDEKLSVANQISALDEQEQRELEAAIKLSLQDINFVPP